MKNFTILFYGLAAAIGFSQGIDRKAEFAPASPNVAEIMRHTLMPVDQYTGIPEINIPIYSIDFDGKEIPVSLRYHAGGIKTNQEASWVGLGWSLSCNAVISRQINYKSDIGQGSKMQGQVSTLGAYCFDTPVQQTINQIYQNEIESFVGNRAYQQKDTQPDIFTANLFGETVRFQLTQKSVTNDNIEAIVLNESKAKIEYHEYNQTFTITDGRGYIYYFSQKEYVSYISDTTPLNTRLTDDILEFGLERNYDSDNDTHIITSWFIEKITSPNGKVLKFSYYGNKGATFDSDHDGLYLSVSPTNVQEANVFIVCQENNAIPQGTNVSYSYQRSLQENKLLQEIVNENTGERLVFHLGERLDLLGFEDINTSGITHTNAIYSTSENFISPKKLELLEVYSPTGKIVKEVEFNQSYFNSDNLTNNHADNYLRLKLDQVTIDNEVYKFDYIQPNDLPAKNTSGKDFWGFYNGQDGQARYPGQVINNEYFIGFCEPQAMPSGETLITGGNLGSYFDYGKIGTLEKVTFPTGGYTTFEFESNTIKVSSNEQSDYYSKYSSMYLEKNILENVLSSSLEEGTKTYKVGGLRVKTITNHGYDDDPILKKSYRYDGFDGSSVPMSSGHLMNDLIYYHPVEIFDVNGDYVGTTLNSSSLNKVYTQLSAQGNHLGYGMVEEVIIDAMNPTQNNGRIVTTYRNKPNISLQSSNYTGNQVALDAPPIIFESGNGKILNQKIFSNVFGSQPKREIINTYDFLSEDIGFAHKLYFCNLGVAFLSYNATGYYDVLYDWSTYTTKKSYALLTNSLVVDYFNNGSTFEQSTTYSYDDSPLLKSKSTSTVNGEAYREEYFYPFDTSYGVASYYGMDNLIYDNRIETPVYIRRYKDSNLLNHELTSYKGINYLVVPTKISFQKEDAMLENMETRIEFHSYDEEGNPIEVSKDSGPKTHYIWGYEREYPVARIDNVEDGDTPISDIIDFSVIDNPKTTVEEYEGELNKIRIHPDYENAMVSTFSYDPLVGLVSETSERGYINYFEYDSRERLVKTKDANKNILKDIRYRKNYESSQCLECSSVIEMTSSNYKVFAYDEVQIDFSKPSTFGTVSEWYIDYGNDLIDIGSGEPSNLVVSYVTPGLKSIRLYLFRADGEFITGNVNVRVYPGVSPGEDVFFGGDTGFGYYQGTTNPSQQETSTGRIYGEEGAIITYSVTVGGTPSGEIYATARIGGVGGVGGESITVYNSGQSSIQNTVEIPASGYVDCTVETYATGQGGFGDGGSAITILSTTKGQIVGPSTLSHSRSSIISN